MAEKYCSLDLGKVLLDLELVSSSPEEVCDQRGLAREQKVEILRRWVIR